MSMETLNDIHGEVKWFDARKGFGFIIGPDKTNRLTILYPATTGRDFHEILRTIDSLKYTSVSAVATPANWKPGDRVMVAPTVPTSRVKAAPKE